MVLNIQYTFSLRSLEYPLLFNETNFSRTFLTDNDIVITNVIFKHNYTQSQNIIKYLFSYGSRYFLSI